MNAAQNSTGGKRGLRKTSNRSRFFFPERYSDRLCCVSEGRVWSFCVKMGAVVVLCSERRCGPSVLRSEPWSFCVQRGGVVVLCSVGASVRHNESSILTMGGLLF